jgi:hypothetical protein
MTSVDTLPLEADSSISLLGENEKPNITYQVRYGGEVACQISACSLSSSACCHLAWRSTLLGTQSYCCCCWW